MLVIETKAKQFKVYKYYFIGFQHCPKNNCNLVIKTKPIPNRADAMALNTHTCWHKIQKYTILHSMLYFYY